MMNDEQQRELKEKMEKLWDKTKALLRRGHKEMLKVSHLGKLKLDLTSLARQRDRLLMALGENVFLRMEAGNLDTTELTTHIERVRRLNEEIASLEAAIAKLAPPASDT